jgi:hypothetical protein
MLEKVFIGWDSRENTAFEVCRSSIESRCKSPSLSIAPLKQAVLREAGVYNRPIDALASTEFSLTRFLIPYLSGYRGFSVFVDCDFLFTADINELMSEIDVTKAVHVVQHQYNPERGVKMDGKQQHLYPRKNWSSLIVFNCAHPSNRLLTPDVVNSESPQYLHRFSWLKDDEIGSLGHEWNYLVGWYNDLSAPKAIHYTEGGPWFEAHEKCEFSGLWLLEFFKMCRRSVQ